MEDEERIPLLIKSLFDLEVSLFQKDDVLMDLADFNDDRALQALIKFARDPSYDDSLLDICGESIAEIWVRRNLIFKEDFLSLRDSAKAGILSVVDANKPEWIKQYDLHM